MRNANSGQIRIIEAFLAVLIIFSAFAVSANLSVSQSATKREDLASVGLQTLMRLDSDGSLGKYIANENFTALREALSLVLPAGLCFNLTVYDEQLQPVNTVAIANGGFSGQDIAFVEYVCASQDVTFHCYVLHLFLAVAE